MSVSGEGGVEGRGERGGGAGEPRPKASEGVSRSGDSKAVVTDAAGDLRRDWTTGADGIPLRVGLKLPSVGRDLGLEAMLMERLGRLICEGALVEVVDVHKEVR